MSSRPSRILLIAGSDSSGGALSLPNGLEADQKVVAAHGSYAMTATTALTAQNTLGVYGIHHIPPEFVRSQIKACIDDIGVDVIKVGMLGSAETISVVADAIKSCKASFTVVDPVMVATTGAQLLQENAVETLVHELLPVTTLLTPNIPEAELLLRIAGISLERKESLEYLVSLAKEVHKLGPKYVLVKGGHLPLPNPQKTEADRETDRLICNVLCGLGEPLILESTYQESKNTHGTGCSLASAIASNVANGISINQAVRRAIRYVEAGIARSQQIGKGNGPINHFHSVQFLPFYSGGFVEYVLEQEDVKGPWKEYTQHDFVKQMGDGSLPLEKFRDYLVQDYLFLIQFSRANALAAYKSKSIEDINRVWEFNLILRFKPFTDEVVKSAAIVRHIYQEMGLHISYCAEYGLSRDDIINQPEEQACTAYTRYVLDIGQSEDWFALQIALLPCLLGYGVIARRLFDDPTTLRDQNRYWKWIQNYVAEDYTDAVKLGLELVEKHAVLQSPSRICELVKIFIHATKMETGFWDMGLKS